MIEKMPGNGKKTIARRLDDLGEALRQNGFKPEEVLESAVSEEPKDISAEETMSAREGLSDSGEAHADLLERLARLPLDADHRQGFEKRIKDIERPIQRARVERDLARQEQIHSIAAEPPVSPEPAAKKGEDSLPMKSIEDDIRRRINRLPLEPEEKAALKQQLVGADKYQLRNVSGQVFDLERSQMRSKAPAEMPPEKEAAQTEKSEPFSDVVKAINDLSTPEEVKKTPEDKATRLTLLRPDAFGSERPEVAHPNAKGISFGSPQKETPKTVTETLGVHTVKENGITRLASPEEVRAFNKKEEHGPMRPSTMTDQNQEDFYEMTGAAASKLINGLDGLSKKARERVSSNVPKIKQKSAYVDESMVPPTVFKGKLSKGVRDPSGSHESVYPEKISNINEILQNPRRQVMFGEFLKAQGHDGLIEKYYEAQKDPSAWPISQNLILHRMLSSFDKRFAAVEQLKAGMTKGDAEAFIRENTELGFLQTGTDSDRAFEVLRDSLDLMLMVMPENEYDGVVDTLQKNQAIRNDYRFKAINERTRKALKDEGVSVEDLKWETIEKNAYLRNAIRRPKFLDWAFGDESSKNSQEMLDAIKFNRRIAGTLLAATVQNDPLFKKRLIAEIHTREKAPETAAQGIAAYEGVLTEQEKTATMEALKPELWTEKIKDPAFKVAVMPNWDTSSEAERADAFSDHLHKSGGEIYIRRGWFARIIAATFGAGVRKTVENLKAQGAFK